MKNIKNIIRNYHKNEAEILENRKRERYELNYKNNDYVMGVK